jgi:hypothetical protein
MRRLTLPFALGLLALLVFSAPALAGVSWCRSDPIVELNGHRVQIWAAIPKNVESRVTGPIQVDITVPSSVSRKVVMTDSGFNGYGENVTFSTTGGSVMPDGSFWMTVVIRVPMDGFYQTVPVLVEIVQPDGTSQFFSGNQWATPGTTVIKPAS